MNPYVCRTLSRPNPLVTYNIFDAGTPGERYTACFDCAHPAAHLSSAAVGCGVAAWTTQAADAAPAPAEWLGPGKGGSLLAGAGCGGAARNGGDVAADDAGRVACGKPGPGDGAAAYAGRPGSRHLAAAGPGHALQRGDCAALPPGAGKQRGCPACSFHALNSSPAIVCLEGGLSLCDFH